MISYSERQIFTERELRLLRRAETLIAKAPYRINGELVRCHELARAVGRVLDLQWQDGRFGYVEHTWLWASPITAPAGAPLWALPNVLDVYVPGALPQVQLVHTAAGLPSRYVLAHSSGSLAIRESAVLELLSVFGAYGDDKESKK